MDIDDPVYRDCSDGPRVVAPSPWTDGQESKCDYCGRSVVFGEGRWWHHPILRMGNRIVAEVNGMNWCETQIEGSGEEFTFSSFEFKGLEQRIKGTMEYRVIPHNENEYVCPSCDSTRTLTPENPKLKGLVWFHCGKCSDWSQHEVR